MKLRDPALEKRLRRVAWQRVVSSPKLLKEYRRLRRAQRDWGVILLMPLAVLGLVLLLFGLPVGAAWLTRELPTGREVVLGAASLFFTWLAWALGCALVQPLRKSRSLAALACLPVHDRDVVGAQARFVAGGSVVLLIGMMSFYVALAMAQNLDWREGAIAVGLGFLQWPVMLALMFVAAALLPRWMEIGLAMSVLFVPLMLLPASRLLPQGIGITARQFAEGCYNVTPAGWVHGALHLGLLEGTREAWWLLAAAGGVLAAGPMALAWLRRRYVVREVSFAEKAVAEAVMERPEVWESVTKGKSAEERWQRWVKGEEQTAEEARIPAAEARQRVLAGEWLAAKDWQGAGMVERAVAAVLDERERMIAEYLTGDTASWSRSVRRMAITAGIVALVLTFLPEPFNGLAFYGLAALAGQAFVGSWPGAIWKAGDGKMSPATAYAPVGYRELIRTMTATACVRALFMLPLAVALGAILVHGVGIAVTDGALIGLKTMVIYVAMHRMGAAPFATNPRSDRRRLPRRILTFFLGLGLGVTFAGAAMLFLIPMLPEYVSMAGAAGMFGLAWLTTRADESHLVNRPIDLVADRTTKARAALER